MNGDITLEARKVTVKKSFGLLFMDMVQHVFEQRISVIFGILHRRL